jgi:hypothetical protein
VWLELARRSAEHTPALDDADLVAERSVGHPAGPDPCSWPRRWSPAPPQREKKPAPPPRGRRRRPLVPPHPAGGGGAARGRAARRDGGTAPGAGRVLKEIKDRHLGATPPSRCPNVATEVLVQPGRSSRRRDHPPAHHRPPGCPACAPEKTRRRRAPAPRARGPARSSTSSTPTRSASPPASETDRRSGSGNLAGRGSGGAPGICTSPYTSTLNHAVVIATDRATDPAGGGLTL